MGGCRCSYKNCKNITKVGSNIHFFHYPVKLPDICKQWIINAEKPQYHELSDDQLRNRVVCETHFEDKCFPNCLKKRLLRGSIPTLDADSTLSLMEDNSQPSSVISQPSSHHSRHSYNGSANNFESQSCLLNRSSSVDSSSSSSIDLLPTNEDSTIFLVQTCMDSYPSVSNTNDIETYNIYRDGSLVPSKCQQKEKTNPSLVDSSCNAYFPSKSQQKEKTNPSLVDSSCNAYLLHLRNDDVKLEMTSRSPSPEQTPCVIMTKEGSSQQHCTSRSPVSDCLKSDTSSVRENYSNNTKQSNTKFKTFENKYLRKLEEHSKDIAKIKRMLKQKEMRSSLSKDMALKYMKDSIPQSLFSVVKNICGIPIKEEEMRFFIELHDKFPEAYALLSEEYNWNLPKIIREPKNEF